MSFTIIIPVWNGASVVTACLQALYAHSGEWLREVICVENASADESASLIARNFPQVHLLRQPVNLGFAGGVNVGLTAATGDYFVLLNQDCLVEAGWLTALAQAFRDHPSYGILGCTVLNADGTLNHAGAQIERPLAYGRHATHAAGADLQPVDYVTGAAFALRRTVWEQVGRFDEGFYPAYYEETDYCYRARRQGIEIGCVPAAQVRHLLSSREWQRDPLQHAANQHQQRLRFVCKHFSPSELSDFFVAEEVASASEQWLDQALGRALGVRYTLRTLTGILADRQRDLTDPLDPVWQRRVQVGLQNLLREALARAQVLASGAVEATGQAQPPINYREQEHRLLARIYLRTPEQAGQAESTLARLWRLVVRRGLSLLSGRDYLLNAQLNTLHVARMDQLQRTLHEQAERIKLLEQLAARE